MDKKMNERVLAVILFLLTSFSVNGENDIRDRLDTLYGEHKIYEQFFHKFKQAVLAREIKSISELVNYPFKIYSSGSTRLILNKEKFVKLYDDIFTKRIINLINEKTFETLFAKDMGLMIGHGEVWFSGICKKEKCDKFVVKLLSVYHIKKKI